MEKHDTILVACADGNNRRHLRFVLNERFNVLEAGNLHQMLLLLEHNLNCVASVVLETSVLGEEEIGQIRTPETDALLSRVPVIIISQEELPANLGVYFHWGAADVIPLHYDNYAMLRRIETITQLHLHRQHLESVVEEQGDRLRRANDDMVDVLSSIIEYRSMESGHHIRRIRNFTRILLDEVMRHCPEYQITPRQATMISSASALHDIGKIAIPDSILIKDGPLTPEEWRIMKTHSTTGCAILNTLGGMADQEYLRYAHNICHYHHERWDGGGYPEGIMGDHIPICAQVVGLADAYEALTSKRVYKAACSFNQAMNMILQGECGAFSPKLLECFKNAAEQLEALTLEYADGKDPEEGLFDLTLPPPGEEQENSLSRTRAKYYALVHYIGGCLVEINLDKSLFHVVYNPYPEILRLEGISTLPQLIAMMLDSIVAPGEREAMRKLIYKEIPNFVNNNLRRTTRRFHYRTEDHHDRGEFELTLLRIDSATRHSLAVLFRKVEEGVSGTEEQLILPDFPLLSEGACICCNDQAFTFVRTNVGQMAGYTVEEIRNRLNGQLSNLIYPEDRKMVRREFDEQLRSGTAVFLEHRILQKDGSVRWVANKSCLFLGQDGREYLCSIVTDITGLREKYAQLQEDQRKYHHIMARTQTVLFSWDLVHDTFSASESWEASFCFPPPTGDVRNWVSDGAHLHPDDAQQLLERVMDFQNDVDDMSLEVRIYSDQGQYRWHRIRVYAIRNSEGVLTGLSGAVSNVDEEKQVERKLQVRAEQDSLTKLLNKAAGRKQIEQYLNFYKANAQCAMLIIDLDNFKGVNDQYGHLFGDAVLTKVAHEIRRHFKQQDIVSRIGGDEFLVLARGMTDWQVLADRCTRLITAIRNCMAGQKHNLPIGCSVGLALSPEDGIAYYDLFDHADQALYQAKAQGKNRFCFYSENRDPIPGVQISSTTVGTRIDSDEEPGLAEGNIVRYIFSLLYTAQDPHEAVNKAISLLGSQTNVSRVYVFENTPDNRFCNNTFEWCNQGIAPEIQNLQGISYETDIPNYEDNFNEQGIFYCPDVQELPGSIYEIVAPQGIKSMLHCAIRQDGVFRGYIGFDECVELRLWTKEEIRMLTYFSEVLAVFLLKLREHEQLKRQTDDLYSLLNNQTSCVYIIDPETFELKYCNDAADRRMKGAIMGAPCYRCMMDRETPCPACPAREIRDKKSDQVILWDERYGKEILAEASLIHWHGEESCLMNCRVLPKRHDDG